MLNSIFDAVSKIIEFLNTLWDFVLEFLNNTFNVIKLVGETVVSIPSYFSWLPAEIIAVLVALFGVVMIYKILGRD